MKKGISDPIVWFFSAILLVVLVVIFAFVLSNSSTFSETSESKQSNLRTNHYLLSFLNYPVRDTELVKDMLYSYDSSDQIKLEVVTGSYIESLQDFGDIIGFRITDPTNKIIIDQEYSKETAKIDLPTPTGIFVIQIDSFSKEIHCAQISREDLCSRDINCLYSKGRCNACLLDVRSCGPGVQR